MKLRVPAEGGEVTAVASFGDKLIVFKADRFFPFFGQGPNAAGLGSTYTAVQNAPADVGCVDPRSIVLGPDGLWFKSAAGLRRLNPDLTVDPQAGLHVDAYAAQDVTSAVAVVDAKRKQLRWTSSNGLALVYDCAWQQWSTFERYEATGAVMWKGKYVRCGGAAPGNGVSLFRDNDAIFTDAPAGVALGYSITLFRPRG
jgi:hypothetical protein